MASINSQTLTTAIVKLIASRFIPALRAKLYLASLVNRDYEPVIQNAGDEISVPLAPTMNVNNLAEGDAVTPQNPAPGQARLTLNCHIEATFGMTDIARVLSSVNAFDMYFGSSISAMASRMESDICGIYPEMTFNNPVGTAGAAALTEADIDNAEKALFDALIDPAIPRYLMVDSTAYSSLRKIPRFTEYQTIGDGSAIATGVIGKVKDFNVLRSSMISKTTLAGTTTSHGFGFVKDSIMMAVRKLPAPLPGTGAIAEYVELDGYAFRVTISYDANHQIQQVTVDSLYGIAPLLQQGFVEVQS